MSVQKDSYTWLFVTVAVVAVVAIIVTVIVGMAQSKVTVQLGDGIFKAQVARTDSELKKGLSGVSEFSRDQVLLFIFPKDDVYGVWMKDMKIPIDIVWLNKDKKVIHLVSNATPESYPKTFTPPKPARYIIELASGTIKTRAIKIGATAKFDETRAMEAKLW